MIGTSDHFCWLVEAHKWQFTKQQVRLQHAMLAHAGAPTTTCFKIIQDSLFNDNSQRSFPS